MKIFMMVKVLFLCSILFACQKSHDVNASNTLSLHEATQKDVDDIANKLIVKYRLVTNVPSEKCDKNIADGNCFEVALSFTAPEKISATNWQIYFSQITPIQSFESNEFAVKHINGDLHNITLQPGFTGFEKNETKTLIFRAMFSSVSEHDALPNYIITANNLTAKVIKSTESKIDKETGLEILPYVEPYTDDQKHFQRNAKDATKWLTSENLFVRNQMLGQDNLDVRKEIIPTPKHVQFDSNNKSLAINKGIKVNYNNVEIHTVSSALDRFNKLGVKQSDTGVNLSLSIVTNNTKKEGAYTFSINDKGIKIVGVDAAGVFNGLQSIASLLTVGDSTLPYIKVEDEPHFAFRGLLIDVARNFHSKTFILDVLEQMGAYKLNKLHLHLGDDEAWRLEIPSLPELTELSSKRCLDAQEQHCLLPQLGAGIDTKSSVNGYYSVSDYQEILRAASARHIQVIPSLDMPGHSRAALKAMALRKKKFEIAEKLEQAQQFILDDEFDQTKYSSVQYYNDNTINVCLESSYAFVTEVMTQVKAIHSEVGHPLTRYHIGADETAGAWINSPACIDFVANNDKGVTDMKELGAYFIERVANILADLNIETAAWGDGLEHTRKENMPAIVQANAWGTLFWEGHKQSHELANRNWQVVLSTPDILYFDFPYEADPKEHGYYWASRQTNTEQIFQFMPENLPVHAEFWVDRDDHPFVSDDTLQKDKNGNVISGPLDKGRKFLGVQGQLWSENTRTDNMAEHKVFPRFFALAERAWHLADWAVPYNYKGFKYSQQTSVFTDDKKRQRDNAWRKFATTLGKKELSKLERYNIDYRLPTVGAIIKNEMLYANIAFPGMTIEYKVLGGEWKTYQGPVKVSATVEVRSRSSNGERTGRTTSVAQ